MNTARPCSLSSWTSCHGLLSRGSSTGMAGDHRVRTLSCAEQYQSMAFAQLTYRESLRDIETCLSVTHRNSITWASASRSVRSTLADANERRDWRIHAALAQRLITQARTLYFDEELGLDLTNTVYALDSTTIALCLSVFSVGALPHHQGGGEDAHAARPAGQHSEFYPHLGWQAARRSCPRYALAGSRSHLRRGSWLRRLCPPLCVAPSRGLLRHACQVEHRCSSRLFGADGSLDGIICDQTISLDGFYTRQDYPELLRRIRFKDPESGKTLVFITNNFSLPAATICALYKSRWQVELFFKWIKQHLRIKQFYGTSENAVKTQIWIAVSVYVLVAIVKKRLDLDASLYTLLQILSVTLFEKMPIHQTLAGDENRCNASQITNQLNLFDF